MKTILLLKAKNLPENEKIHKQKKLKKIPPLLRSPNQYWGCSGTHLNSKTKKQ